MRRLVFALIIGFLAYGGWWYYGQSLRSAELNQWFDNRESDGWIADSQIDLQGFPNRYDAVFTDLNLANPTNGWAWRAKKFQLAQLSYKPNHLIAIWPSSQTIATPDQTLTIQSDTMRASIELTSTSEQNIEQLIWETSELDISSDQGWGVLSERAVFALRKNAAAGTTYQLNLTANGTQPNTVLKRLVDSTGILPETLDSFEFDASFQTNAPLGLTGFEAGIMRVEQFAINDLHVKWGDLVLRARGDLSIDAQGYPTGDITLRAVNWTRMLDMARAAGSIDARLAENLKTGITLLTAFSGEPNTLNLPLSFSNQQMRLGPIPIGEAPRLMLP